MSRSFKHEFFLGASLKYSTSDAKGLYADDGIKISSNSVSQTDPTAFYIYALEDTNYFKEVASASIQMKKVFNTSWYDYFLILGLQRSYGYVKYQHFSLKDFSASLLDINQVTIGFNADLLLAHKQKFPLGVEYIYNDDSTGLAQTHSFKAIYSTSF